MRLMLGIKDEPWLLVEVEKEKSPCEFDFYVVNGAWDGTFTNGYVTIWQPDQPWTAIDRPTVILCDNQDRLRGNYNDVFANFDNAEYVAPKSTNTYPEIWDDDVPF